MTKKRATRMGRTASKYGSKQTKVDTASKERV